MRYKEKRKEERNPSFGDAGEGARGMEDAKIRFKTITEYLCDLLEDLDRVRCSGWSPMRVLMVGLFEGQIFMNKQGSTFVQFFDCVGEKKHS